MYALVNGIVSKYKYSRLYVARMPSTIDSTNIATKSSAESAAASEISSSTTGLELEWHCRRRTRMVMMLPIKPSTQMVPTIKTLNTNLKVLHSELSTGSILRAAGDLQFEARKLSHCDQCSKPWQQISNYNRIKYMRSSK